MIEIYKRFFKLEDWYINTERIQTNQVICNDKVGKSFVGAHISRDIKKATIYHTRELKKEDIIHELLHIKYPILMEEEVVFLTDQYK